MALKEAYEYIQEKNIMIFDNEEDRVKIKDTVDKIRYGKVNVRYYYDDIVQGLKSSIIVFGSDETVWVYFGEYKGLYMPRTTTMPRIEEYRSNEPYIETTLKHALEIFKLIGEKSGT